MKKESELLEISKCYFVKTNSCRTMKSHYNRYSLKQMYPRNSTVNFRVLIMSYPMSTNKQEAQVYIASIGIYKQ